MSHCVSAVITGCACQDQVIYQVNAAAFCVAVCVPLKRIPVVITEVSSEPTPLLAGLYVSAGNPEVLSFCIRDKHH